MPACGRLCLLVIRCVVFAGSAVRVRCADLPELRSGESRIKHLSACGRLDGLRACSVMLIAFSAPCRDQIISLVGSLSNSSLAFILPALFYLKLCRPRALNGSVSKWEKVGRAAYLVRLARSWLPC